MAARPRQGVKGAHMAQHVEGVAPKHGGALARFLGLPRAIAARWPAAWHGARYTVNVSGTCSKNPTPSCLLLYAG